MSAPAKRDLPVDNAGNYDDEALVADAAKAPLWMRLRDLVPARFRAVFPPRFLRFCLVGGTGVFVNVAVFQVCQRFVFSGLTYETNVAISYIAGIVVSIFSNFMLNHHWTFGDLKHPGASHFFSKLWKYFVGSALGAVVQWGTSMFFFRVVGMWAGVANIIGIAFGVVLNFVIQTRWTFRSHEKDEEKTR